MQEKMIQREIGKKKFVAASGDPWGRAVVGVGSPEAGDGHRSLVELKGG